MSHSPPGSSVHGVPQARILEWAAVFLGRKGLSFPLSVVSGGEGCRSRDGGPWASASPPEARLHSQTPGRLVIHAEDSDLISSQSVVSAAPEEVHRQ